MNTLPQSLPDHSLPRHLYVHVPFCRTKCTYCAFHSTVAVPPREFAQTVQREVRLRVPEGVTPQTIFLGGGTPTALGPDGLLGLCTALRETFSEHASAPPEEWTIEANPGTLTPALAQRLHGVGVTRLSLGVQSFDPATLAVLGRCHDVASVHAAVAAVRIAGIPQLGLDLIAGVPGLSEEAWRRTLATALSLAPDHLSVYALTVEPGTPLACAVAEGRLCLPDDDAQMDALALAEELLAHDGYTRYEISNYARNGCECRHNLAIWHGEDFLGVGPAAASRWGLRRWTNAPDVNAWSAALQDGTLPPCEAEDLTVEEDAEERFLTGLRLAEGVAPNPANPHGARWSERLEALSCSGVVEAITGGRWRLTARGREVADAVLRELIQSTKS